MPRTTRKQREAQQQRREQHALVELPREFQRWGNKLVAALRAGQVSVEGARSLLVAVRTLAGILESYIEVATNIEVAAKQQAAAAPSANAEPEPALEPAT